MNIEELREYCIEKPFVTEEFPFDETTLVFKVNGKMFALTSLGGDLSVNLKCEPEKVIELREKYAAVIPGYHMNKTHWNTIYIDGTINVDTIKSWIDDSYYLVIKSFPKKVQNELLK